jgi:uroporphyrinogen decarboxylase
MGLKVELSDKGPELPQPIRSQADVDRLVIPDPSEGTPFVLEIIRRLRRELAGAVPLIGFAGAPWTLAAYMVEGGGSRNYMEIKRLMYSEPRALHQLLGKIADTVALYLRAQVEAGAQLVQLFDSWAGELSPADYTEFALPYERRVFEQVPSQQAPTILYLNGCAAILEQMATCGADALSIDWRLELAEAKRRVGDRVALQGNLDPCVLLGPPAEIERQTRAILAQGAQGSGGHIMNLGHGILPPTPVDHARTFIETVKTAGRREDVGC